MILDSRKSTVQIGFLTDPEEVRRANARREKFERNSDWLQAHISEVYSQYRGKCICVAGQELFAADRPEEVIAQATAAHPEDDGALLRYIPKRKVPRIYYAC